MSSTISSIPVASPNVLPANPSARVLLVLKFLQSFNALDLPSLFSCLSDDEFVFHALPEESIKSMGRMTVLDRSGLEQEMRKVVDILKAPELIIREIVDSESANKVVVYAKAQGRAHTEHPFTLEFMITHTLGNDSNGELKIKEYDVFFDTLYFQEFFGPGALLQANTT